MRLFIDTVLGLLAGVSITFPWLTSAGWQEGVVFAVIAIVLLGLILLLHLKPKDHAEKLLSPAELRSMHSLGNAKDLN
jgi:hypothetical protein